MKKRTLTTVVVVVVLAVLALSIYNFTGHSVISLPTGCSDTDNPNGNLEAEEQANVKGTASYSNRDATYTDFCVKSEIVKLNEYYCQGRLIKTKIINCDSICEDCTCINGACA